MSTSKVAFVTFAAATVLLAAGRNASAIGPSAMPSRIAQYFGYGYGPGHQAPIVRTPGHHPQPIPRYERIPRHYGPLYPAPYAPIGCYGDACYGAPSPETMLIPSPAMVPQPLLAPTAAPTVLPQPQRQARRF